MTEPSDDLNVRLDKWLWAARFFKTRSMAAEAVSGGKVHVNDARAKPARPVKLGDELAIRRGAEQFTVIVKGLSSQRGPAPVARQLYEETEQSRASREAEAETRRLFHKSYPSPPPSRPNKKDRRHIIRFRRQSNSEQSDTDR